MAVGAFAGAPAVAAAIDSPAILLLYGLLVLLVLLILLRREGGAAWQIDDVIHGRVRPVRLHQNAPGD
ncbi:hypothetical protein GCM10023157_25580 [Gluconacetobacter asukensis]